MYASVLAQSKKYCKTEKMWIAEEKDLKGNILGKDKKEEVK